MRSTLTIRQRRTSRTASRARLVCGRGRLVGLLRCESTCSPGSTRRRSTAAPGCTWSTWPATCARWPTCGCTASARRATEPGVTGLRRAGRAWPAPTPRCARMGVDLAMAAGCAGTDLVHSHTWYANLAGHIAKLLHGVPARGRPRTAWSRCGRGRPSSSAAATRCRRGASAPRSRRPTRSSPCPAGMRRDVLTAYPAVDPDRVHVVHNGIDTEQYAPDRGTDVLDRLGIDPDRAERGLRRPDHPAEGPALPAAGRPRPAGRGAAGAAGRRARHAGDRGRGDGAGRRAARRPASGVIWVQEMLPKPEVIQVLTHATVFVCPSIYEPMGIVNLEAMACETAVVATATGGIPEVVADGETGLLVPIEQVGRRHRHAAGPGPVRRRPGRGDDRAAGRPGPGRRDGPGRAGAGRSSTSPGADRRAHARGLPLGPGADRRTSRGIRLPTGRATGTMAGDDRTLRFPIEQITPALACGAVPREGGRRRAGARVARCPTGRATTRSGCNVVWRGPDGRPRPFTRMAPGPAPTAGTPPIQPDAVGDWTFAVEAFADPYLTWRDAVTKKIDAGQGAKELANDLAERRRACSTAAARRCRPTGPGRGRRGGRGAARRRRCRSAERRLPGAGPGRPALAAPGARAGHRRPTPRRSGSTGSGRCSRPGTSSSRAPRARSVDRPAARCGTAPSPPRRSGCRPWRRWASTCVYLPPIHPIGRVNRKGRNNALVARPEDVGSPWAIGSAEGGHDAIHPQLGTPGRLPARSSRRPTTTGLEVAMDLALQCAPDHPWVKRAPGVVHHPAPTAPSPTPRTRPRSTRTSTRSTSTTTPRASGPRCCGSCCTGSSQGVKIFRVDNPHTKPIDFWHWLIWRGQGRSTRTCCSWPRRSPGRPSCTGSARSASPSRTPTSPGARRPGSCASTARSWSPSADHMRPNFWPNTPDILHETPAARRPGHVQDPGGAGQHALARRGASTPGYELFEHVARPGAEEYLDNEKYQLRPRDWAGGRAGRRVAGPVPHPAQRDPPGQPGPALAAQPALPRGRQRRRCCAGPSATRHRQHGARGLLASTRATRTGATPRWTCRRSAWTGTSGCASATS